MTIAAYSFPVTGFLGTGATFAADLNLMVQFAMGGTLLVGFVLARKKRYKAHGACQASVLVLNLAMIGLVMGPSFHQQIEPRLSKVWRHRYYTIAAIHGISGTVAEMLGLYIIAVAGTRIVPPSLRFKNWKLWMRTELVLWFVVLIGGIATYFIWYVAPFP